MKIIIPIKQVPETGDVKMDSATGTMKRDGVRSIVNPLDLYAIETGLKIKESTGAHITVITMGPPKAAEALKEAVAMGCDDAMLLSDKSFAGSDTCATSYVLAMAIKKIADYNLVICGERATDGDTGQVGPGISAWLNLPVCTYISKIISAGEKILTAERLVEDGYETLEIKGPCVITVVKEAASPRLPTLSGKIRAKKLTIPILGPSDINAHPEHLGLAGSPTKVVKIETPKITRNGELIIPKSPEEMEAAADKIIKYFHKLDII
ncbi:MAG: electron transfer flavoprotein subunit beta [Spirochaetes bacterium GWF1_41_5]|nr:MAG: electron transfer flavoprotein subunit beta [Spirochaetes bacterium GWF1_41_5]HBE03627.1 electron transfer flavoprotein subunit beta [Spirochaetia bacterium]